MIFSVVIPTCRRTDALALCLERLAPGNQTFPFAQYEVIVTDDGEGSAAAALQQNYGWVKWVKGPGRGPAANRNHGVAQATGKWIAFTDDDCLPDAHWLQGYADAIALHSAVKVFEGRTYADRAKRSFYDVAPVNEVGGHLPSCNFCIERHCFFLLNGFDEDYLFNFEDMDLHYRLQKMKHPVLFVANASVCHPWRQVSSPKMRVSLSRQELGIRCFVHKHPDVLSSFNSFHFIKEAIRNMFVYTLADAVQFRGSGIRCALLMRQFELKMSVKLLPVTIGYLLRKGNVRPSLPHTK